MFVLVGTRLNALRIFDLGGISVQIATKFASQSVLTGELNVIGKSEIKVLWDLDG
jgi:hypothetical protein